MSITTCGGGSKSQDYSYDSDRDSYIMEDIVVNNPELTFEDIMEFKDEFLCKCEKSLRRLYDEVRELYGYDDEDKTADGNKSLIDWHLFND